MPSAHVVVECGITRSPRVMQAEGIFDVPAGKKCRREWKANLPIEERDWRIGLIVGPSGCGKSTIARKLFGDSMVGEYSWPPDKSILDAFPKGMPIREIVGILSSVGFNSPPSWLRPFQHLSNGEQFRVTMARAMAEAEGLFVADEFTSVVDRTVAKTASSAIEKAVRRSGRQFIAVTCHEDIEEWLNPDWVFRPAEERFAWRCLRRRPEINLKVCRVHWSAWELFRQHHYLSGNIHRGATCFCAFWNDTPVGFVAWQSHFGRHKDRRRLMRVHRTVVLPDYQGVGVGRAQVDYLASMYVGLGMRASITTSHPAEISSRKRSSDWRMRIAPGGVGRLDGNRGRSRRAAELASTRSVDRLAASFEYCGPAMQRPEAERLMNAWAIGGSSGAKGRKRSRDDAKLLRAIRREYRKAPVVHGTGSDARAPAASR